MHCAKADFILPPVKSEAVSESSSAHDDSKYRTEFAG